MKNIHSHTSFSINNTYTYGIEQSVIASGYPMQVSEIEVIKEDISEAQQKRANVLGNARPGSGHDCYLKGCLVQADFSAPQYWWKQAQRYHWFDFVSSQSTMHRITKMDISKQCNEYVLPEVIAILEKLIAEYNSEEITDTNKQHLFQVIVSNIPSGLILTARISTNYLQLKTMYNQRKTHKLEEWNEFCKWCEELPYFEEFCIKN